MKSNELAVLPFGCARLPRGCRGLGRRGSLECRGRQRRTYAGRALASPFSRFVRGPGTLTAAARCTGETCSASTVREGEVPSQRRAPVDGVPLPPFTDERTDASRLSRCSKGMAYVLYANRHIERACKNRPSELPVDPAEPGRTLWLAGADLLGTFRDWRCREWLATGHDGYQHSAPGPCRRSTLPRLPFVRNHTAPCGSGL